jgi:hypothetical protein
MIISSPKPEPPDLRASSNVDFQVAWITGPATDPSLHAGVVSYRVVRPGSRACIAWITGPSTDPSLRCKLGR